MGVMEDLNPRVMRAKIGVRKLYQIDVYPMSLGDQIRFSDRLTAAVAQFTSDGPGVITEISTAKFLIKAIQENLDTLLGLCADEHQVKEVLGDAHANTLIDVLTNEQLVDIAEMIYQMNYEVALKKGKSLFEKINPQMIQVKAVSERPSPDSSDSTPSTDLSTYLEKDLPKGESL